MTLTTVFYLPQILLRQAKQVREANRPDIGRPPISRLVARNVQNTYLAEILALGQRHEHFAPVVGHHVQPPALYEVHLFADVAPLANKVARTEHLQLELGHQLLQESRLTVLEYWHSLQ